MKKHLKEITVFGFVQSAKAASKLLTRVYSTIGLYFYSNWS